MIAITIHPRMTYTAGQIEAFVAKNVLIGAGIIHGTDNTGVGRIPKLVKVTEITANIT